MRLSSASPCHFSPVTIRSLTGIALAVLCAFLVASPAAASTALSGTITAVRSSTSFVYQTGSPHGFVPVSYSPSMLVPSDGVLNVGETVTVVGTLSSLGYLSASSVTIGSQASGSTTLAGTITAVKSSTSFVYQTGFPHGAVPVTYSPSMLAPSGATLSVGQSVTVVGTLSHFGYMSAGSVTVGSISSGARYHIATWAIDDWGSEGQRASAASVVQLLSYGYGNGKAVADCHAYANGCKAVFYVDPNHLYNGACAWQPDASALAASSESWFVHQRGYTTSSHRVHGVKTFSCGTSTIFEMNPNSKGLQAWYRNYLQTNADNYDYYFIDDDSMMVLNSGWFASGGGCLPWPALCHSTQEIVNDLAEVRAHASFANAMHHRNGSPMRFFYQGTSFNNPLDVGAFVASNHFVGMTCEACAAGMTNPVQPNLYAKVLDGMAAMDAIPAAYVLISHGLSPAGSPTQILQRLVTTGIVWLGYSEGHTIVWPNLEANTTSLAVWPEDLIYPSVPVQSMRLGATDLEVAPGVYRREFASCYQRGIAIGQCAALLNANRGAVTVRSTWLRQSYHHAVTLAGGDVLSRGVANVSGTSFIPNRSALAGAAAILLTR